MINNYEIAFQFVIKEEFRKIKTLKEPTHLRYWKDMNGNCYKNPTGINAYYSCTYGGEYEISLGEKEVSELEFLKEYEQSFNIKACSFKGLSYFGTRIQKLNLSQSDHEKLNQLRKDLIKTGKFEIGLAPEIILPEKYIEFEIKQDKAPPEFVDDKQEAFRNGLK